MRTFALFFFAPALVLLTMLAAFGGRDFRQHILVGALAGFAAAVAYDVFRLPFVYSHAWGLEQWIPQMNLFKVFPRFGAMLLGEPLAGPQYSAAAHWLGWIYHFSNGMTFGVMYVALAGSVTRRSWAWAVLFAVGIEIALLLTPYARVMGIPLTALFVYATLAAHLIFGAALGQIAGCLSRSGPVWVREYAAAS